MIRPFKCIAHGIVRTLVQQDIEAFLNKIHKKKELSESDREVIKKYMERVDRMLRTIDSLAF